MGYPGSGSVGAVEWSCTGHEVLRGGPTLGKGFRVRPNCGQFRDLKTTGFLEGDGDVSVREVGDGPT